MQHLNKLALTSMPALLLCSHQALAYIGPGMGAGTLGVLLGLIGSVFLALLLRCHKLVRQKGGELVLCGASKLARELLHITNLDTLWAIYDTREEALEAVGA